MVTQGEIWLLEAPNLKARPVLVVTRNEAIPVLDNVVVAPVTSTIRLIATCIPVGVDQGIDHDSVASFDSLSVVPKAMLTRRLGGFGPNGQHLVCSALAALAGC